MVDAPLRSGTEPVRGPVPEPARGPSWPIGVAVGAMVVLSTFASFKIPTEAGTEPIDDVAVACGIVGALGVLLWRRSAIAMVAVTAGAMFAYTALDYPGGPALLPGPVMLGILAYVAPRRTAWIGAGAVIAAVTLGRRIAQEPLGVGELLVAGWALAAVLGGQAIRARSDRVAAERERRAQHEREALAQERLRIAQDLHDSVAHAMATINVQSGVAAHLLDRRPEQAREALEAIRVASADALDELGAILGVLREPGEAAPRAPTGRLEDVDALVERARRDGLAVTVERSGDDDLAALPPSIGTAGFRVVQEALTNVRRHAGDGATASVRIDAAGDLLVVEVQDDGGASPRPPARPHPTPAGEPDGSRATVAVVADPTGRPGPGFGLIGMRERVESSGGALQVGPRTDGGFVVRATWKRLP